MQASSTATSNWVSRRHLELDWLRVLAFGLLILFHIGMLYAQDWGWHYKSGYRSEFLQNIMLWSNQWRMSLLFLISGVAISYMLEKMTFWQFWRNRHAKILVPLLFGMAVVVVPQVYIEQHSLGELEGTSYWRLWQTYFDVEQGLITWNHLWYLSYIFVYSLIIWLLYPIIRSAFSRQLFLKLSTKIAPWALIVGPIFTLYLCAHLLYEKYPSTGALIDDWYNNARYFSVFLLGFALVRAPHLWTSFVNMRHALLALAICSYCYILYSFNGGSIPEGKVYDELSSLLWSANSWLWIATIVAWAQAKLNFSNAYIRYLNGGVYCYYILHQTLILIVAFYLVPLSLGPIVEPLVIVVATFSVCLISYELIKRMPILRHAFGVKVLKKQRNEGGFQ
ncbi:acyltransferase family protein [Teredinibacter purpureus]|uniref:acyltransferase family protein n=1 Tax=Teredinibacter purpureus TaxID=2731756 RepID=UPI0005F89133|nr:acyltransferase family protein [Teredinibacter purpureus]